jgi:hypothetical protein
MCPVCHAAFSATSSILCHDANPRFCGISCNSQNSFKENSENSGNGQEDFWQVGLEENSVVSYHLKGKEGTLTAADQRHLNTTASIANITTEVEINRWKNVRKLSRPMVCQLKWFMPLFTSI